ncbi:MAG: efflux RND transporter periplasmic adaptor subunit [Cyclobacteriaceae bacterium]|nr:efflux RND transporter periplasmic adaptor subunit [Cyclobacteriaceae bacterium]UYN87106.1 MAG: efflux RND transporter periplasmic adaptor subunit [Cyclobacteriaceae bacterium]
MKRIWILGLLSTSLFWIGCRHHNHQEHEAPKFTVTRSVKKDTVIFKEYVCQIRAIQHIELRALERGYLQNIYVDEGQLVKKGQRLFQIMPVIYQAETQKAQAEVSFAEIEYLNTKALADSNIVSKNELALAKAKLEKARAELTLAQAHLGFTEIRAPFDGIVGRFNDVRLGSLVDEGELLTTLSDNSKMWVYFNVPEAEYLEYASLPKSDSLLRVKLQLANNKFFQEEGIVETIEADFNNETGNIAFRATFKNPNGLLRSGETGNILMPIYLNDVLVIPQKATFEVLDRKFVFVAGADSVVRSREIRIGAEMPHLYTVVDGLQETDMILVEGLRKVKNGQKISYEFHDLQKLVAELHNLRAE